MEKLPSVQQGGWRSTRTLHVQALWRGPCSLLQGWGGNESASLWHMTAQLFMGNGKWCEFIWGVAKQKWPNSLWNLYNTRQLKEPLFPDPKNILRSKCLQTRLLGACVQLSVCLSTICSCWPTFSFCLDFCSPQAAVSTSWCFWGNNQYCSHFNSLATEKAKSNIEVSKNKLGQQTPLFKLLLHYNYKAVGKRWIDILICHKFTASTPLSSVPFCRVLGKCQSRL